MARNRATTVAKGGVGRNAGLIALLNARRSWSERRRRAQDQLAPGIIVVEPHDQRENHVDGEDEEKGFQVHDDSNTGTLRAFRFRPTTFLWRAESHTP
jgi:hypothetical protein